MPNSKDPTLGNVTAGQQLPYSKFTDSGHSMMLLIHCRHPANSKADAGATRRRCSAPIKWLLRTAESARRGLAFLICPGRYPGSLVCPAPDLEAIEQELVKAIYFGEVA